MASPVFHLSCSPPQQFPTADIVARTECEPGNKVCCVRPPRHVAADLTEQWQRAFLYAWNLRDIQSEEFVSFGTQIEFWMGMPVLFSPFASGSISWGRREARTPAAFSRFPDRSSCSVADRFGTALAIDGG